ncbi:hypothetical protein [Thiofaba sp. EF100]|uniref:hypothetical protein n=1 Tax=Thiofaba sp. EF100 TaxID=3121274 RepID=UPI003221D907
MRLRCPVCHAEAALEAWVEDEAARELFGLLAGLPAGLGRAMVQYLGLWRPAKRALAWDRALRIAREATALAAPDVLERALVITIEAMRSKRDAGDVRPLDSHAYLIKVIESVAARGEAAPIPRIERAAVPSSRTAQAMAGFLGVMPDG